nr:fasciclin-like arabinogalactan protein 21 [Ipomoea batatas]
MDFRRYGSFNILTISLPLFCLLITWAASTATTTTPGPPPSVHAAAEILRTRGYSLIASTLLSTVTSRNNFSGTILAPPDFAFTTFSFTAGKFSPNHRVPLRPSAAVLLYHTLREPLMWHNLSSLGDGKELPTFYRGDCLFVRNSNGAVSVSVSAFKKPISAVRIKQPDMYADDHLVVHGVDGVLDPTSGAKCSGSRDHTPAGIHPPLVDRKFLDHAVRAIRRRGFTVAAAGLSIKRSEMLRLGAVSLFAPSDRALFSRHGGFSFDFRSHVLPTRHRLEDLARYPPKITIFPTLAANRTIMVDSVNGAVTVNGVRVNSTEVYLNRWIVVFSVSTSLDYDAGNLLGSGAAAAQIPPPPHHAVQYPPPTHFETPLPLSPPSTAAAQIPPPPHHAESQCRISDFPVDIEGGDLLCPVPGRLLMEDGEALTAESAYEDAAQSLPSDEDQLPEDVTLSSVDSGEGDEDQVPAPTLRDQVNIADDLFFYS